MIDALVSPTAPGLPGPALALAGAGIATALLPRATGALLVLSPTMTTVVVLAALPVLIAQLRLSRQRVAMIGALGRRNAANCSTPAY